MLDQETKRKIDNARDILVGKVPDPKSQVEQITIALIYKFMDDMDKESQELGGKAAFFTGEFEKFTWSRIFDPRLGGFELIALYSEAIAKMNHNENIPQLFRDIFKNAFLPYRDPETLKSFLKEINEFKYDHSEKLGDAFEYLLSVLGSQGDAGQFRTPRHIIDFIVEVVDPKKNETILDPACATAGFLISSYKHILKQNTKERKGDCLTMDERKRLMNSLVGYDISPDMVRLSLVNMYLHGFQTPKIYEYDTLTSEEKWNETYDVILANPPFMTPKGGIRPHKRFSVQANRSEVLFVDYIMEHLTINGRAGVIVPEGIIFQSANAYKALRKLLVESGYLFAVVSLPQGVFQPYSGVKTSILLMDKSLAKRAQDVLFVKIENEGFDLGAQRRAIDKNDFPRALDVILRYKKSLQEGKECEFSEDESKLAHRVLKTKIAGIGDYYLSGDRYRDTVVHSHKDWPMVELGEVTFFKRGPFGGSLKKEIFVKDGYKVYEQKHAINNNFEIGDYYIDEAKYNEMIGFAIKPNDIIISCSGTMGKVAIVPESAKKGIINQALLKITPQFEKILPIYLKLILEEENIQQKYFRNTSGAAIQNVVSVKELKQIKIPLPPLSVQQEIVAEIEGYQKIIDGARQVVENYKPRIKVDEGWEVVDLGDACEIETGKLDANAAERDGIYPFFTCSKTEIFRINSYAFDCEALLLSGNNASGDFDVKYCKGKFNAYQRTYIITIKDKFKTKLTYPLLNYYLQNSLLSLKQQSIGGLTRYLTKNMITSIKISIPAIEIQKEIVARIEEEQKLVDANKKLIELFEGKIKAKIAEVWG
ncbi:MAG: N-6 DNA methylase [Candidatus Methanoperedens sp.]|nr:N-6 DNA methylase [Candidatus Methanoperedens sp.]MCZ7371639.1 N-6 DNA methylase [Candidatus Methanoperedens sp.]